MYKHLLVDKLHISLHGGTLSEEGQGRPVTYLPQKPDAPFLVPDKPWESRQLNWVSMLVENGLYRVWYEAFDNDSTHDCECRLCYAESRDGKSWTKPELGLKEYNGSRANNIVVDSATVGGMGIHGHSIFIDPTAPPKARYRCVFLGILKDPNGKGGMLNVMSYAYSADGIVWHHGDPELPNDFLHYPFLPFGSDTQCSVFWDPGLRKYVGYFRAWHTTGARSIARSETNDLRNWPMPRTILSPDLGDPQLTDYYNCAASRYRSDDETLYFLFYSMFDHDTQKCYPRVAVSRDGEHFDRVDRKNFLENDRDFDAGMIFVGPGIHDIGNGECAIVYNGTNWDHGEHDVVGRPCGSVMVRFPKDRLVGIGTDSFYNFTLDGWVDPQDPEVYVNADVKGRLRAALIVNDRYLEGFGPDDCEPLSGDLRDAKVTWRGAPTDAREACLKIFLEDGVIFSATVNRREELD